MCKVSRAYRVPQAGSMVRKHDATYYLYHTVRMMYLLNFHDSCPEQEVSKSLSNHVCYCVIRCNGTVKKQ